MLEFPSSCVFPDDLDEAGFLQKHWQQTPLLLRQAFPGFAAPLSPDELAGLSLETGTTARLIVKDDGGEFRLEYGPFDEDRFASLGAQDWSLLITDVEKHVPELRSLLTAFLFLPSWRIDDVMISYAPDGASVGAHVDEYDVFLLQASGQRRWLIEDAVRDHAQSTQGDLRLVEDFSPTQDLLLSTGDMLYLPPGIAHHGIAVGDDCTTWSIGFRALANDELIVNLSDTIAERLVAAGRVERYRDPPLSPAVAGELDDAAIQNFMSLWHKAIDLKSDEFSDLFATMLTQNSVKNQHEPGIDRGIDRTDDITDCDEFDRHSFAEFVWHGNGDTVSLYADGKAYACSRALAVTLCGMQLPTLKVSRDVVSNQDRQLVQKLVVAGVLVG